ncbi:unnamed protein product [Prunus brigantina]
MAGLIPELDLEDLDQASKTKNSKDPPAPTVDGSVPIGCVEEDSEISDNLSCSTEEELGKVSLLGGCDQNSVLDGGNCMKSEVSRNSGGGEPENNENGNEISKSKIEDENAARKNAILFRKQKLVSE